MTKPWWNKGFDWDVNIEGPVQIKRSRKLCSKKHFILIMGWKQDSKHS